MSVVVAILMTARVTTRERGETSMSADTLERRTEKRGELLRLGGLQFDILCEIIDDDLSKGIKATQYANTKMMNALRDDFRDYRAEFKTFTKYVETRFDGMAAHADHVDKRLDGIDVRLNRIDGRLDGVDKRLVGIETRLDGHDKRFDQVDTRLDRIDTRLDGHDKRFDQVDTRLDRIDTRLDGHDKRFDQVDTRLDGMSTDIKEILRRLPAKE
jgi:archaellum component FlaC